MAWSLENVSPERIRLAPAALKTPPPSPAPPCPPEAPAPPTPSTGPASARTIPSRGPPNPPSPPFPPAPPIASFAEMTQLFRVSDPTWLKIAPPSPAPPAPPGLPLVPTGKRSAPGAPVAPAAPVATLSTSCTEVSVTVPPEFKMPPPTPAARPFSMTTFEIATRPLKTWNTRSRLLPLMTVFSVVLPLIVRLAEMSRSPLALPSPLAGGIIRVYVPPGRMIVSAAAGCASAAMMADRNEMSWFLSKGPALGFSATVSLNVLTVNVERTTRPSSASRHGRLRVALRLLIVRRLLKVSIGCSLKLRVSREWPVPQDGPAKTRGPRRSFCLQCDVWVSDARLMINFFPSGQLLAEFSRKAG